MTHHEMSRAAFPHLSQTCWCGSCDSLAAQGLPESDWRRFMRRMNLCPDCGNKRCPKATHHANACTGSNQPGQPGSAYIADGPS